MDVDGQSPDLGRPTSEAPAPAGIARKAMLERAAMPPETQKA
jgi:hypothetical protein